jgi:hypothetical protein
MDSDPRAPYHLLLDPCPGRARPQCPGVDGTVVTTIEQPSEQLSTVSDGSSETVTGDEQPAHRSVGPGRAQRARTLGFVIVGYVALALVVWWHIWSNHPTSTTTCGCGDSSLFTWFLAWPAYALSHGLNPLYSTALFHPTGINLLSNTAEVGIGVILAPVTWLFGPVATLNVALTLSPVVSALAMYVLLRRWTSWAPAAFAGGLLYGFSPFILISLTDAHLMLGTAPVPPLIVACLDELFIRQKRRPLVTGGVLGLLVAVQFFIGSELLVLALIAALIGVVLLLVYGLRHRDIVRRSFRYAATALVAAAVSATVLLAYPVWFALAGPAHLVGPVWGPASLISYGGTNLKDYLFASPPSPGFTALAHRFGGYQAPTLSGQYLGIGLLAVLALGLILWRRDRRLWLFAAVGAISVPLSFGLQMHTWTLWRLFVRLPLMENIIPSRFLIITYLAAAVMLGVIVDRTYAEIVRLPLKAPPAVRRTRVGRRRLLAAGVALAVAAAALVPIADYYSSGIPLTTQRVVLPPWYRTVAPHLPGHQVVLAFPVAFDLLQSAMTWQAVDTMSFAMVGGGGPDSLAERAGPELAGQTFMGTVSAGAAQTVTPTDIGAVRRALDGWGVTMVVVPDPSGLPEYEQLRQVRSLVVLMTAATGQLPVRQAQAWVWAHVQQAGSPLLASASQSTACSTGAPDGTVASIARSAECVAATTSARS